MHERLQKHARLNGSEFSSNIVAYYVGLMFFDHFIDVDACLARSASDVMSKFWLSTYNWTSDLHFDETVINLCMTRKQCCRLLVRSKDMWLDTVRTVVER
jgi:hypothetical protein